MQGIQDLRPAGYLEADYKGVQCHTKKKFSSNREPMKVLQPEGDWGIITSELQDLILRRGKGNRARW